MDKSLDVWELAKENIQPIQQGRKPNILKAALVAQPEDLISQQRQNFEQELRIYSGNDPLSVWCRYIKWVEQNFPKGGKEGHIDKLIQQCLSVLKDESKYFNDQRFVDVWLKYANITIKPIEVYNYMYSHNIGHKSSSFFIAWAWELEQLSNWKKADEILSEGIHRNAEPIEKLKTARSEFENRMAIHIKSSAQKMDTGERRSAFSLLNPQNKRNEAPISRIGDSVIPTNRESMTLGHRQPQPKSTINSKVPFKIYNSGNNASSLPLKSENATPYVLHSDASKENEKMASKWNKVKLPKTSVAGIPKTSNNPGFIFHCDEGPQSIVTPKSGSRTASILSSRKNCASPPIALFEPHDPMKRPMYDKNKVYGGAEEFSFEEIRAAKWFEKRKQNIAAEEQKLLEQKALKDKVKTMEGQLQQFQLNSKLNTCDSEPLPAKMNNAPPLYAQVKSLNVEQASRDNYFQFSGPQRSNSKSSINSSVSLQQERDNTTTNGTIHKSNSQKKVSLSFLPKEVKINCEDSVKKSQILNTEKQVSGNNIGSKVINRNLQSLQNFSSTYENFDSLPQRCNSASYSEAANMVQELYNGTFTNPNENFHHFDFSVPKEDNQSNAFCHLDASRQRNNLFSDLQTIKKLSFYDQKELEDGIPEIETPKNSVPFCLYHDPTDVISYVPLPNKSSTQESRQNPRTKMQDSESEYVTNSCSSSNQVIKENIKSVAPENAATEVPKNDIPFSFYHDATDCTPYAYLPVTDKRANTQLVKQNIATSLPTIQGLENENAINSCSSNNEAIENIENVAPAEYVQETVNRELAGILVPSKNVPFLPLEDQNDLDYEVFEDEEDIIQNPVPATLDENTFNYTKQFATAPFLASTPCIKSRVSMKGEIAKVPDIKNQQHILMPPPNDIDLQVNKSKDPNSIFIKTESAVLKESDKYTSQDLKVKYGNSHISPAIPGNRLSIIMESSGECYSKSSSSSCSSSACSTKLGFSHYSHQHSISHKQLSKTDTLTEIDCPGTGSKMSKPSQNLSTLKEEAVPLPCEAESQQSALSTLPYELYCLDISPFESQFTLQLLDSLPDPIGNHRNMYSSKGSITSLKIGTNLNVEGQKYTIEKLIAEGAYAKVYAAKVGSRNFSNFQDFKFQTVALKVSKDANGWEFYICTELHNRLSKLNTAPNIKLSVMEITSAITYYNGMALVSEYSSQGTLLDVINIYMKRGNHVPEFISMYFTLEMLLIISQLHKCNIVHADLKPDNFLLTKNALQNVDDILENLLEKTSSLCLIDFGRAIDLSLFKTGVCFKTVVETENFQCNEMKESKPWVFQPDWYGVLGCIHVMLFSEYMKVRKNSNGYWEPVQKFKRYWLVELWQPLFHTLMNIPSCYEEPDLKPFIDLIAFKLRENATSFIKQIAQLEDFY